MPYRLILAFVISTLSAALRAQALPPLELPSLAGAQHHWPAELHGRPGLLVVGFTRASGDVCAAWQKKLWADAEANSRAAIFGMANLQGVPGFVLPLILRAMRKGMPERWHDQMLIQRQDRDAWKRLLGWSDAHADDAYLVLVDGQGAITWMAHGVLEPGLEAELRKRLGLAP